MDVADLDRSLERSIKGLVVVVWHHKIVFLLTSSAVFAMITLGSLAVRPLYEASTLLISGQTNLERLPNETGRPTENLLALARIAESQEVLKEAIAKVGLQKLPQTSGRVASIVMRIRGYLFGSTESPPNDLSPAEKAFPRIRAALSVRPEVTSDLISIAFRHPDPIVATDFANAVAQAFIDRQIALLARSGATDFLMKQRQRFDDEVKQTAHDLEKFSVATSIFSAEEQRQLLLRRLNELAAASAVSRTLISEKTGQRQALAETLRRLAPVARSSYVSTLVESLSGPSNGASASPSDTRVIERAMDGKPSDAPILLVKVYQDSMVELFKLTSDLAGLQNRQKQEGEEMAKLTANLNAISENEEQFSRLKRAVEQATYNEDLYSKRLVEEQIAIESRAAKFSSVRVVQKATVPERPTFPNYNLVAIGGSLLSLVIGIGAAYLRHRFPGKVSLRRFSRLGLAK